MSWQYDVCLSFAGEDRQYVEHVAESLHELGLSVFYDRYEEVSLWGKNLYEHLDRVYRTLAQFCVVFASTAYASKVWARHELTSAQARAISEHREYILPARFDNTEIRGILPTTGYIDLRTKRPSELARLIAEKIASFSGGNLKSVATGTHSQEASHELRPPAIANPSRSKYLVTVEGTDRLGLTHLIVQFFLTHAIEVTRTRTELLGQLYRAEYEVEMPVACDMATLLAELGALASTHDIVIDLRSIFRDVKR